MVTYIGFLPSEQAEGHSVQLDLIPLKYGAGRRVEGDLPTAIISTAIHIGTTVDYGLVTPPLRGLWGWGPKGLAGVGGEDTRPGKRR